MEAGSLTEDFTARSGVSLDSWRRDASTFPPAAYHRPRKIGLFSGEFIRQLGRIYDLFDSMRFKGAEPLMDAILGEASAALRRKDRGAVVVTSHVTEVGVQRAARLIYQINVAEFLAFVAHIQPADLRAHMRVFHQEMRHITDAAPSSVP